MCFGTILGELEKLKGMECIGYRNGFSKKENVLLSSELQRQRRIAQVCMNSYLGSKYFCILDFHLNLI